MATQTTYYEFIKPEGTDLVNPLVDTNPNWDALDADLHDFNLRSIANCTEIVTLGVHAISRLDQTAKFLKWIATANFTAGDTFTVDGLVVAASTPAGATLATNAYVSGSVVLACLNADNSAMTIFVSGSNVADDSQRLGGELPSYYGTAADVSDNASNITNLQNQVGNTSIVGIGDGTCTGAIDALNNDLTSKLVSVTTDGLMTTTDIFTQLWTAFNGITKDVKKINAKLRIVAADSTIKVFHVRRYGTSFAVFNCEYNSIESTGVVEVTEYNTIGTLGNNSKSRSEIFVPKSGSGASPASVSYVTDVNAALPSGLVYELFA